MRAIITEYTGSGYTAKTDGHHIRVSVNHALNSEDNHANAALALCDKIDGGAFRGDWVGGYLGNGKMAWVLTTDSHSITMTSIKD